MEKKKNDKPFIIPPSFYKLSPENAQKVDRTPKTTTVVENETPTIQQHKEVETVSTAVSTTQQIQETHTVTKEVVTKVEAEKSIPKPEIPQPNIGISKERVSGLSLKGLQRKKEHEEKRKEQKVDVTNLPKDPFTEIAMQAAWKEYVTKLSNKGEKIIASNLEADTPKLVK